MTEKRYSKEMSIRLPFWLPLFALSIGAPLGYAQEISFGEYTCLGPEEGRSSGGPGIAFAEDAARSLRPTDVDATTRGRSGLWSAPAYSSCCRPALRAAQRRRFSTMPAAPIPPPMHIVTRP